MNNHKQSNFQLILNQIRDRVVYSFKQQPDSATLMRDCHIEFSELIEKTIEKYCGAMICEYAPDFMRDISDVAFDELIKYKIYENTNNMQVTNVDKQISEPLIKQQDEYSNMYDSSVLHYTQQTSPVDDGENDNKYRIELAESENRPLTLIGSDEEDNDSDREENKDSELETAVSRQDINSNQNATVSSSGELHSNGHEYIIVHHVAHDQNRAVIDNAVPNDKEKTNENQDVADS
ncbi:unnamed protein product [Rotaria socialis]|uniref:Uncharacterized protein n=2 Tax=Rotaria socialis TaxID=392032 RepID=A0A821GU73_9BILA|nr:unnamed protein product [Rotaria socialis]